MTIQDNMTKIKPLKQAHTSNSKIGSGDYYGVGVRNPVGRVRENSMTFSSPSPVKMNKPPKSLA